MGIKTALGFWAQAEAGHCAAVRVVDEKEAAQRTARAVFLPGAWRRARQQGDLAAAG